MSRLKKSTYHPLLIGVFPVLFFYSANQDQIRLEAVWVPLAMAVIVSLVLLLTTQLIYKDWQKSGVATAVLVVCFFSYGHLVGLLDKLFFKIGPDVVIGPNKVLFPATICFLLATLVKVYKSKKQFVELTRFLNICTLVLVLMQVVNIYLKEFSLKKIGNNNVDTDLKIEDNRDIYYIVLDAYARSDTLKNLYDWDNSQFETFLKDKGFFVVENSNSNYAQTFFSLASSLNMEHVDYLEKQMGRDSDDASVPMAMIGQSQVVEMLKKAGYQTINLASGWEPTDNLLNADINYSGNKLTSIGGYDFSVNEFTIVFLQTTILSPFVKNKLSDMARDKVLAAFDRLGQLPYQRGNKFVLAHFNVPHPPYLFDEDGNKIDAAELELAGESFSDRVNYLKQLKFVNKKMEEVIGLILTRSENQPIIIVQSDHGPASVLGHPYKWPRPASDQGVKERMDNFEAMYLPGLKDNVALPKTPVNIFRFIFNQYFGTSYDMLPDTVYFTDYNYMYDFIDVTKIVK